MAICAPQTDKLEIWATAVEMRTIAEAASLAGQSISEFVLASALTRAGGTLADRRFFGLTTEQWTDFTAALDAPPAEHSRLRQLLREPSVFDLPDAQ